MRQGADTSAGRQPGDATLALLAEDGMLAVLAELRRGEARARDIESRVPGITRRTALRRLRTLAAHGYAGAIGEEGTGRSSMGRRGSSPDPSPAGQRGPARAPYVLTELGRVCLPRVVEAAARCERKWWPPPSRAPVDAGLWTIGLIVDLPARAIVRALADAPLRQSELLARQPQFARSTLLGRLRMLSSCGLLVREAHPPREVRYGLTDGARQLVVVALRAAACEGQGAGAREDPSPAAADLPGLLHMLAPLARVDRELAGACRWRLDSPGGEPRADTYLTARSGRIAALATAPTVAPEADGVARPEVWCEALLRGDPSRILVNGDRALFDAIFGGLAAALLV
jgi:DNA-binding HxlR family transcriptional regulator